MSREWKPGDVGAIPFSKVSEVGIFVDGGWVTRLDSAPLSYEDVRPLVVIDPEDREQVERLASLWAAAANAPVPAMQAALREFADPKPPKPEEPTGLGAVVEDSDGTKWVRGYGDAAAWQRDAHLSLRRRYDDIAAVRVLSEGVQ